MQSASEKIEPLIKKLRAYSGDENYMSKDELAYIAHWLENSSDLSSDLASALLDALNWFGINRKERIAILTPAIIECFKSTPDVDVGGRCLYLLCDSLYYGENPVDTGDIKWTIKEGRWFNNESRGYKLAKSQFLARVVEKGTYSAVFSDIYQWVESIIASGNEEYVDLLAFSLIDENIRLPKRIMECFEDYLETYPDSEGAEEIEILLESNHDEKYACPVCGYYTFKSRHYIGSTCEVCYWQLDGREDGWDDIETPMNGRNGTLSVAQARGNYQKFGAIEERYAKLTRKPRESEIS